MFTVLTLFALFVGVAVVCAVAAAGALLLKFAFKLVLLPLKLLLIPFMLVIVVVKFAVILALVVAVVAVLIPILVVGALCLTPFAVGFLLR